jgi:hypothetical protein
MSTRTATASASDPKAGMSYDELAETLALYRDPKPDVVKATVGFAGQIRKIELRWEAK